MKKVIYLYKSGTLSRQDNSLVLRDKKDNISYIPIEQIDTIICFGEVSMNKRVFALLNQYSVTILFYNYYGNYIGRYSPDHHIDGKVLVNQVHAYEYNRVSIAYTILKASLTNCLAVMKYYNKKGNPLVNSIQELQNCIYKLDNVDTVEDMLLIEAKARKVYYDSFDIILKDYDYHFERRSIQPPENEINAMMSYGYAILYGNYLSVLDRSRLHSEISFIHSLSKNKESLQFDLADILKPVLVDRLILSLIRRKLIKKEYFEYNNGRCYLNKEGAKFFVGQYEDYLTRTITINSRSYSYRNLISREVHLLSNYIAEETNIYEPYTMGW